MQKVENIDVSPSFGNTALPAVFSSDEMIAFGNFIRDNYYVAGTPKMLSYHPEKYPHANVDEIFVYWCLENGRETEYCRRAGIKITKLQFSTSACLLAILCCVLFLGCKPEPELYINGKPFYTRSRCVESETETIWEYHYGYNTFRGKYEFHYGPNTKTECVKSVIDTVEIK